MNEARDEHDRDDLEREVHALLDGALSPERERELRARIERDPDLARRVRELEAIVNGLAALRSERAPAGFDRRVLDALSARPAGRPAAMLRRVALAGALATAASLLVVAMLHRAGAPVAESARAPGAAVPGPVLARPAPAAGGNRAEDVRLGAPPEAKTPLQPPHLSLAEALARAAEVRVLRNDAPVLRDQDSRDRDEKDLGLGQGTGGTAPARETSKGEPAPPAERFEGERGGERLRGAQKSASQASPATDDERIARLLEGIDATRVVVGDMLDDRVPAGEVTEDDAALEGLAYTGADSAGAASDEARRLDDLRRRIEDVPRERVFAVLVAAADLERFDENARTLALGFAASRADDADPAARNDPVLVIIILPPR